jgi:hypothetical protein
MTVDSEAVVRNGATEQPAEQKAFHFPVSNEIFKEYRRLGDALWLYLFYIDRTTQERVESDGTIIGRVFGGVPRRDADASSAFGVSDKTIRKWRARLKDKGFIRTKQTGHGSIVEVVNSQKWAWKRKSERNERSGQTRKTVPDRKERPVRPERNERGVPYIDSTETIQKQTETSATDVAAARDFALETYRKKFNETPNWFQKDFAELEGLFLRKADLTLDEFKRRWNFYLESNSNFYKGQGHSLRFFCLHAFDALRDGPQAERGAVPENSGMSRRELERRRSEISPEARRMYGIRV